MNQTDRGTRAAAACSSTTGVLDKTAPGPNALLPSSVEVCTSPDVSQSLKPESLKSTTTHTDPDSEGRDIKASCCVRLTLKSSFFFSFRDLCAAILLACLFCQPLDCLLATFRGCSSWTWSLCTSMCGCKSTSLQPLLDVTPHCDLCDPVGPHCCLCDCAICDICRQTTECLDFAMEVSQMLYH